VTGPLSGEHISTRPLARENIRLTGEIVSTRHLIGERVVIRHRREAVTVVEEGS